MAGEMRGEKNTSLCYLSTFAWIFPTFSAVNFLAFAFLAITFWSKECVITGIEGLMSSGSVTNVTGTLFRMRNTIYFLHEHLVSLRTQHRQLIFPPQNEGGPIRLRTFLNQPDIYGVASFVAKCLALFLVSFWFGFRLFPSFRSNAPQRNIYIYSDGTLPYLNIICTRSLAVAHFDWWLRTL